MNKKLLITAVIACSLSTVISQTSCLPEGIHFHTQEEIDSFQINYPGCTEIEGNVTIDDMYASSIYNLNGLSVLTAIGGNLNIGDNLILNNLTGLEGLTTIGGSLSLHYLNSSAFTNLSGLDGLTTIGGSLSISHCNYIINFAELDGLNSVGGNLHITYNLSLNDLTGLNGLTTFESVYIGYNQSLNSITGLEGLTDVGYHLWIVDNDFLTSILVLEGLTEVGGSLSISNNSLLTNLAGLECLTSIGLSLHIENNPILISLTGLENVNYIGSSIYISGNEILPNLQGLNNISFIEEGLYIKENNTLTDLTGLNGLTVINGFSGLNIISNDNLTSLTGIENLEMVKGDINIGLDDPWFGGFGNPVLNDISALENVNPDSLGYLNIVYNYSLSECSVQSICDYLAGVYVIVEIHDNAPGCNSIEEVEEACNVISVQENVKNELFSVNPNPVTTDFIIEYTMLKSSAVVLRIIDVNGQVIKTVMNEKQDAGEHAVVVDAKEIESGVYFCVIETNKGVLIKKVVKM